MLSCKLPAPAAAHLAHTRRTPLAIPTPRPTPPRFDFATGHHKGDILLWRLSVKDAALPVLVSQFKLAKNLTAPILGLSFLGGKKDGLLVYCNQEAKAPAPGLTVCSLSALMQEEVSRRGCLRISP